ncbi:MAG: 50S ribosome-binding GTPase [Candidatus Aegiribacteria sp.]|nr:50S ribosome-binding GTPase [Candidatus Aegiribacteria sp.]
MNSISPEIICAVATPEGTSALSIIRVSGKGSFGLLENIMSLEKNRLRGMRRKVGRISEKGRTVDEVVAVSWPEGKSFTGEEMVEIICHGIPQATRTIMEMLIRQGARRAEPGEFARRALGNGKMNAVQIITLAALWDTEKSKKVFNGETEESCMKLLNKIETAREIVEGNIEFDEIHLDGDGKHIRSVFCELMARAKDFRRKAASIEKSCRVMIMGPTNSGKSTLFNVLTGKQGALVSDEPGTTRDGSTCFMEVRGRRIQICDTAGSNGIGLDRKASEAVIRGLDEKDRVIWMSVGGRIPPADEVKKRVGEVIEIAAKSDLKDEMEMKQILNISSVSGEGLENLRDIISRVPGSMSLSGAAERIEESIKKSYKFISSQEYDLAAEHINEAEIEARRIIGKGENIHLSVERALNSMCVGK